MLRPCPCCGTPAPRATCPHCGGVETGPLAAKSLGSAVMLLGLTACFGATDVTTDTSDTTGSNDTVVSAEYGVPDTGYLVDEDGDGITSTDDCDDTDASIYPGAPETPGDGVDSNCDGNDDT